MNSDQIDTETNQQKLKALHSQLIIIDGVFLVASDDWEMADQQLINLISDGENDALIEARSIVEELWVIRGAAWDEKRNIKSQINILENLKLNF